MSSDHVDIMLLDRLYQEDAKVLAKCWIRAIEPRKQTYYTYTGGKLGQKAIKLDCHGNFDALIRPPWWPTEGCRYREPDHLKKAGPSNNLS